MHFQNKNAEKIAEGSSVGSCEVSHENDCLQKYGERRRRAKREKVSEETQKKERMRKEE